MKTWWFCFVVSANTPTPIQPAFASEQEGLARDVAAILMNRHPEAEIVIAPGPDAPTMIQLALHSPDCALVQLVDNMIGAVNTAHLEAQLDPKPTNLAQVA